MFDIVLAEELIIGLLLIASLVAIATPRFRLPYTVGLVLIGLSMPLLDADFRVTRIASTGGFMCRGNSTLLIGVEKERVEIAVHILHDHSAPAIDPGLKRATIFVLKVDQFEYI